MLIGEEKITTGAAGGETLSVYHYRATPPNPLQSTKKTDDWRQGNLIPLVRGTLQIHGQDEASGAQVAEAQGNLRR